MSDSCSNVVDCLACSRPMPEDCGVQYSREVIHFRTEVDELKEKLMQVKTTDLQHILNFLVKERDDLLILFCLTKEIFTMDAPHFKEFKNWIHDNRVIHLPSVLKEAVEVLEQSIKEQTPGA